LLISGPLKHCDDGEREREREREREGVCVLEIERDVVIEVREKESRIQVGFNDCSYPSFDFV
jgi:hypothetical protein